MYFDILYSIEQYLFVFSFSWKKVNFSDVAKYHHAEQGSLDQGIQPKVNS